MPELVIQIGEHRFVAAPVVDSLFGPGEGTVQRGVEPSLDEAPLAAGQGEAQRCIVGHLVAPDVHEAVIGQHEVLGAVDTAALTHQHGGVHDKAERIVRLRAELVTCLEV